MLNHHLLCASVTTSEAPVPPLTGAASAFINKNLFSFWRCVAARTAFLAVVGASMLFCGTPVRAELFVLHSFAGAPNDGQEPHRMLVANGGVLYGVTLGGGVYEAGTAYRIGIDGSGFSILRSFANTEPPIGLGPSDRLVHVDGLLYGINKFGGTYGSGTVYRMNTNGGEAALLHAFSGPDGKFPRGGPVVIGNTLYGMTWFGGGTRNQGTIFKTNLDGSGFKVLRVFRGNDGAMPVNALLADGNVLYGMTLGGGAYLQGTVFRMNSDGTGYAALHHFAGGSADGAAPYDGLALSSGSLFGMTSAGGAQNLGTVFRVGTDGAGFSVLHSFSGLTDGEYPYGSLTVVGDWLYGMTTSGGSFSKGTIFRIRPDGTGYSVVHEFSGANGHLPVGTLIYENGILYGVTGLGGDHNMGTVFALTLPAPPCQ